MAPKIKGTVCLIDPDRELHPLLAAAFALEGFRVVSSASARDAQNKIERQKFAAIFIDLGEEADHMAEVLKVASTGQMNAKTPFVVLASRPATEIPPQTVPLIRAALAKPFTLDEIVGVLRELRLTDGKLT